VTLEVLTAAVERRRSPTPRHWCRTWNRAAPAGFGASALCAP